MRGGMPMAWWNRSGRGNWGWWVDPRLVPGGAWIDHSIYAIAEMRFLLGDEPASVTAKMANLKYPRSVLKVEDYGIATYTYRKGTVVTMEYDWIGGMGSSHSIVGTKGSLRWGSGVPDGKVELRRDWKSKLLAIPKGRDENLLNHILGALDGRRDTCSPARLGQLNLKIALAAYRASKTGRTVRI
jgi:predicted dehydrogenase